ncbi:transposable element Tcb2 transposase [Trichonephila clavipes]|uniref:Transposable element Tcb2 transposase n=1 Tax=Trichonephila clavipes TaxID=2585209 RepID=A0A8X6WKX1_TRICX|nr:transposable element Tcb2 transposase [Trichonephila clavipes]
MNHASICRTMMAAFVLDAMPVNAAFQCVLSNDIVPNTRSYSLGCDLYHGRTNLLRIEDNLNSDRYVREVLQPEVVPFLQGIPRAIFQQDNARPYDAKSVRDFCSAQHMQLLPWPAYSTDMSPIEHMWDLVGWRRAHDPSPLKDELLLLIQAI